MRLIDAGRLQGEMMDMIQEGYGLEDMVDAVIEAPTVDAVPVVRCKDCRFGLTEAESYFCDLDGRDRKGCWFCADGERKGGNE